MLLTSQEGSVATVTINRPEVLNMLTHELILRLTEEIQRWSAEKAVRVIIVAGSGEKAFVGGVDVKALMDPDGAERLVTDLHRCFLAVRQSEKLIIASVNGFALGAGLQLVASCDVRITTDRARFGMPEVWEGIPRGHRSGHPSPPDRSWARCRDGLPGGSDRRPRSLANRAGQ